MIKKHNFKQLLVWKESMDLVKHVYRITSTLPDQERFMLWLNVPMSKRPNVQMSKYPNIQISKYPKTSK
ncbi:MAG: four helix bundle protein [Flavobacteriia bacterium]|nr:four helix bundle protein [Flavobacteriia bacterium]